MTPTASTSAPAAEMHNHQHCIDQALQAAEELCARQGSRFTAIRRKILEMVWQSHKAVKAYDLLDKLAAEGGSAKPPTVYRALDFLMEQGLVHKIESLNAYIGCPHPGQGHVSQFLICDQCLTVQEVHSDGLQQELSKVTRAAQFRTRRQTIEVHGLCSRCTEAS